MSPGFRSAMGYAGARKQASREPIAEKSTDRDSPKKHGGLAAHRLNLQKILWQFFHETDKTCTYKFVCCTRLGRTDAAH